jgi:Transposase.
MGRAKGKAERPNKYWSKEEKVKIVLEVLKHEESLKQISNKREISSGMVHAWIKKYLSEGEKGLENKVKPGCPYKGLNLKKELTDIEKLQLENMKLKVENERLKKGYIVEGDGQTVIYDKSKFQNLK